jgi:hypothetical protein
MMRLIPLKKSFKLSTRKYLRLKILLKQKMKIDKRVIALLICIYYLIIAFVGFIITSYGFYSKIENVGVGEAILIIPLQALSVILVVINWKIIFTGVNIKVRKYLLINKWVSFFQIIKFKLLGFFYFFSYGSEVIFYYINQDSAYKAGVKYNWFDLNYTISYFSEESVLLIGVNALALMVFFVLNKLTNSKDEEYLNTGMIYGLRKRNE